MTATNIALLHGGGQGAWIWDETIAAIRLQAGDAARVIAFDLPGCGSKREADVARLTVRDVAAAFVADLVASGMTDIVLVGHSNAGTILPLVARLRPDLIRRYVYVACIAPPPGESVLAMIGRRRIHAPVDDTPSGGRLRTMFCNDMDAAQADAFMARLHRDHWPTRAALDEADWAYDHLAGTDATFVICLRDQAEIAAWQEEAADRIHAARRVRIDAGHQVMNTRPHGLAEILLAEAALA